MEPAHDTPEERRAGVLTGGVHLRFAGGPTLGRLYWPGVDRDADEPRALILLLADGIGGGDRLGPLLSRAGAVVLVVDGERDDEAVLSWAADHAAELGADATRLLLAGERAAAGRAAWLALRARDSGWPPLAGQLLMEPTFGPEMPTALEGVVAATIATSGADAGARYAELLRAAGIEVDELRLPDSRQLVEATARACARPPEVKA